MDFADEVRAYLHHRAEQNPILHGIQTGQASVQGLGIQQALELLAGICADQTNLLIRCAEEIDKLRAAPKGG